MNGALLQNNLLILLSLTLSVKQVYCSFLQKSMFGSLISLRKVPVFPSCQYAVLTNVHDAASNEVDNNNIKYQGKRHLGKGWKA